MTDLFNMNAKVIFKVFSLPQKIKLEGKWLGWGSKPREKDEGTIQVKKGLGYCPRNLWAPNSMLSTSGSQRRHRDNTSWFELVKVQSQGLENVFFYVTHREWQGFQFVVGFGARSDGKR